MRTVAVVALLLAGAGCGGSRLADATLWFDDVAFHSPGTVVGAVSARDLPLIREAAVREVTAAFAGYRVAVSTRPAGRYHVRVVQRLRDLRQRRAGSHAGESRAINGFGGSGAVSFEYFAALATSYAPPAATRDEVIAAIGRCLGRGAVHEFAHQLLPTAPIHDRVDRRTYEYYAGGRPEHCYGPIGWGKARPWLLARYGAAAP